MWNQLKQTIPKLIRGDRLASHEVFGDQVSKDTLHGYRKSLLRSGVVVVVAAGGKMRIGDETKAKALIENPMNVARLLWPTEASEWEAQLQHVQDLKVKSSAAAAAALEDRLQEHRSVVPLIQAV